MRDGDGDERGDILFLNGKVENKILLKVLQSELQWFVYIQSHCSQFLNFLAIATGLELSFEHVRM